MEKCCRVGQATVGNIIRRMRIAFSVTKVRNAGTHSEYLILTSHGNSVCANARQHYVYASIGCIVVCSVHLCSLIARDLSILFHTSVAVVLYKVISNTEATAIRLTGWTVEV